VPAAKKNKRPTLAQRADRHVLYQKAVQDPAHEIAFISRAYRDVRGRAPRHLREDFCGTALVACEWVRGRSGRSAQGVDLDADTLAWGEAVNAARLSAAQRRRLRLLQADVLNARTRPADVVAAFNFSYWVFKERAQLLHYFRQAHRALKRDGVLLLDAYGGYEAPKVLREHRVAGGFTYVWHQADYDPVSGDYLCHIDFKFRDGSQLKRAFTYEWRLWTLPELRELLVEAGFQPPVVYWEGTDAKTGGGDGVFKPARRGDPDGGWVAYLAAAK
jgi:SAM-dependent methyltransferase